MTNHFEDNLGNEAREITNHLKEYLQDAAPAIDEDYRNLQRTAFREVIKLSAATIRPVESQIESRYHTAKKTAQTKIEEARNKIESRFKTDSEEARRHNKDRLAEIDTKYEPKLNTLETDAKAKRDRLASTLRKPFVLNMIQKRPVLTGGQAVAGSSPVGPISK